MILDYSDKNKWLKKVHFSFKDFIDDEILQELVFIQKNITNYTPSDDNVLRFLSVDITKIKVIIIGQDPYPSIKNNVLTATGRAYEVSSLKSFNDSFNNVSLKNIIRLIYKSLNGKLLSYNEIKKIYQNNFKKPKDWFDGLEKQGVLFLNTIFTTALNQSLAHQNLWNNFTLKLITYLNNKNKNCVYFLWGKNALKIKSLIKNKTYISRHPMMCSDKYEDDFLKNNCFLETKDIIDWSFNV